MPTIGIVAVVAVVAVAAVSVIVKKRKNHNGGIYILNIKQPSMI